jgi:hypothetical protein
MTHCLGVACLFCFRGDVSATRGSRGLLGGDTSASGCCVGVLLCDVRTFNSGLRVYGPALR